MPDFKVKDGETKKEYRERLVREQIQEHDDRQAKLATGETPFVMDVDDLGFLLPGHDDLLRLKKSLPGLKMTCFTIPLSSSFFHSQNAKHFKWESYKKWARMVNDLGWLEIALHGFAHTHSECDCTYETAQTMLTAVENIFSRIELKYVKLIKAPYWQTSYDFLTACRDRDYTVAIDRNHPRPLPEGLKTYLYNWSYEEPLPGKAIIKGHGHFTGPNKNNISDTLHNILTQVPRTARFMTVSEYLNAHGDDSAEIKKSYSPGQAGPQEDLDLDQESVGPGPESQTPEGPGLFPSELR